MQTQNRWLDRTCTRRELLKQTGAVASIGPLLRVSVTRSDGQQNPIAALLPRGGNGHQFVLYADCCSGRPGTQNEINFAAINKTVVRLSPRPDFICFPGDTLWLSQKIMWIYAPNGITG